MLYHVPDRGRAIAEIRRVLRPGGLLLNVVTRPWLLDAPMRLVWRYRTVDPADIECAGST